jgi:hypothetical protein
MRHYIWAEIIFVAIIVFVMLYAFIGMPFAHKIIIYNTNQQEIEQFQLYDEESRWFNINTIELIDGYNVVKIEADRIGASFTLFDTLDKIGFSYIKGW